MSEIDSIIDHWGRLNCCMGSSLSTSVTDACAPAIALPDMKVRQLYYLQGTSKVLHPKPNIPVRSAWTAPRPVRKTTTPSKFIKARKKPSCTQNTNNCRTNDKDFKYSVGVTKIMHQQQTTSNVRDCKLSQCNSSTEERTDMASSRDEILFLDIQLKQNCVVSNNNSVPKHTECPENENKQDIKIVELFPGVKSYILDMSSIQSKENKPENNESKLEEQLFSTLNDCPEAEDNSDDTSISWYRKIVQRELEEYLKRLSKGCDQGGDEARQSPSSRQSWQHSSSTKVTDNDLAQELTQSRRINKTASYVSYILWKKSLGKSKFEKPKVWKPPG